MSTPADCPIAPSGDKGGKDFGVFSFLERTSHLWLGALPLILVSAFAINAQIRQSQTEQDAAIFARYLTRPEFEERAKALEGRADERYRATEERLKEIREEQKAQREILLRIAGQKGTAPR